MESESGNRQITYYPLYKIYRFIAKLIASKKMKEESYYIIEKGIFLVAYIIRKLKEIIYPFIISNLKLI